MGCCESSTTTLKGGELVPSDWAAASAYAPGGQLPEAATAEARALYKQWQAYSPAPWQVNKSSWESQEGQALEPLLDDIDLVDLGFIIENAEAGLPVPRWQDVPLGARINRTNLHRIQECISPYALSVLVLSYPWLDPEHPDRQLATMRRLLPALKAFYEGANKLGENRTVGLLMDYPCLPQRTWDGRDDRSPEEMERFERGLATIHEWYKHPYTTVLIFDVDMPGAATGHANLRPYSARGWCTFEFAASCLVKTMFCLWSLKGYENGKQKTWAAAVQDAKAAILRVAPVTPEDFSRQLRDGVLAGDIAFTAKGDLDFVIDQYESAFVSAFAEAKRLMYQYLKWPDSHMLQLAKALAYARERGLLKNCISVYAWGNECSSEGRKAVEKAMEGLNVPVTC